jgi:catalase (peroxidase I)
LLNYEWEVYKSPGGQWQWRVKDGNGPKAPKAHGVGEQDIMMLTTDIALVTDRSYRIYVEEFARDKNAFDQAFADVWYKLTHRDVGPTSRLLGPMVPSAQEWQYPLPSPPAQLADMKSVEATINNLLYYNSSTKFLLVRLAMNSANTFRHTDYLGGCNGARIRFHLDWEINKGLDKAIQFLEPVKQRYGQGLSWADLIVLAGNVAVKHLGAPHSLPFVGGRTDAADGSGWNALFYMNASPPKSIDDVLHRNTLRGLSPKEYVALAFPFYTTVNSLKTLIEAEMQHPSSDPNNMLAASLKYGPFFRRWVDYYINVGDSEYKNDFASTWTKIMNMDRFSGPVNNAVLIDLESQSRL